MTEWDKYSLSAPEKRVLGRAREQEPAALQRWSRPMKVKYYYDGDVTRESSIGLAKFESAAH